MVAVQLVGVLPGAVPTAAAGRQGCAALGAARLPACGPGGRPPGLHCLGRPSAGVGGALPKIRWRRRRWPRLFLRRLPCSLLATEGAEHSRDLGPRVIQGLAYNCGDAGGGPWARRGRCADGFPWGVHEEHAWPQETVPCHPSTIEVRDRGEKHRYSCQVLRQVFFEGQCQEAGIEAQHVLEEVSDVNEADYGSKKDVSREVGVPQRAARVVADDENDHADCAAAGMKGQQPKGGDREVPHQGQTQPGPLLLQDLHARGLVLRQARVLEQGAPLTPAKPPTVVTKNHRIPPGRPFGQRLEPLPHHRQASACP
mmetsp:Transcript_371/g.963  ORF Transcript_371/g.963 Transcript_371/m.963 type:complete len:312 (-) Transcript_371:15-950(-)